MFTRAGTGAALILSLLAPAALLAQTTSQQRNVIFFANGGGATPVTDLNDAGTASLKTGWAAGGGVGVQINPYVAVRGTFDLTQTEGEGSAAGALSSANLNHYFYGGDVQLRYPTASGFAPYLLLGAGAVNGAKTWLTGAAPEVWLFFLGALFILVTLALPKGLVGLRRQIAAWRPWTNPARQAT